LWKIIVVDVAVRLKAFRKFAKNVCDNGLSVDIPEDPIAAVAPSPDVHRTEKVKKSKIKNQFLFLKFFLSFSWNQLRPISMLLLLHYVTKTPAYR